MSKIIQSLKWVLSVNVLRKLLSFLLFLYIVNVFSRTQIGSFREFTSIIFIASTLGVFSFDILNIVFTTKKYFFQGLQFILLSSVVIALTLFCLKSQLSLRYDSQDLYTYFLVGFWLVIPYIINIYVKSFHQLDMNFKLISLAEATNIVLCVGLSFIMFLFDQKFIYYFIAFYTGVLAELCILSYPIRKRIIFGICHSFRLRFISPLKAVLREKFSFLSINSASTFINSLFSDAPILLLGLFYHPSFMGNYFIAFQLVMTPLSLLMASLSQVMLPAFSLTESEVLPTRLEQYFKHVICIIWIPIIFFGILLKNWGYLVIGDQDIDLINAIIVVIIIRVLFLVIMNPVSSILAVLKKPQYELYWSIGSISAVCVAVFLFRNLGFLNMIIIHSVISIISMLVFLIIVMKIINISFKSFIILILKGLFYALPLIIMLVFAVFDRNIYGVVLPILTFLVSACLLYLFEKKFLVSLKTRFIT